MKGLGITAKM